MVKPQKMKTKTELDQEIINLTTTVREKFPELAKYITEMPVNTSGNEEIGIKNLEDYCHSLEGLVNEYSKTHTGIVTD
jgi:hypothetical protein